MSDLGIAQGDPVLRNLAGEIRGAATGLALVALALLVAVSVNLGIPGQSLLQSLRFHIGLASLALPIALLVAGARLRAALLAMVIVASLGEGGWVLWQQMQRRDAFAGRVVSGSFEMISFNVLTGNRRAAEAADYVIDSTADIVVTMETSSLEPHLDRLSAAYPVRVGCQASATCDTAIFSRLPLRNARVERFGAFNRERLVLAQADIDGQIVTIVAVHLTKPYFDGLAEFELYTLAEGLRQIEGPLVLVGDFNAAAWSDALIRLSQRADLVPPPALPATWPVVAGDLGIPIDNMFTRGDVLISSIGATPALGSNHRGLMARVEVFEPR